MSDSKHRKLFDPLLADQRLEYVLPEWRYAPHRVHAVYPSNRYIPLKVRRFVDGLATYLQAIGAFTCTDQDRQLTRHSVARTTRLGPARWVVSDTISGVGQSES
jgi:hypothetical protein